MSNYNPPAPESNFLYWFKSTYIGNKQRYNFKQRYNLNVTFVFDIVKYIKAYILTDKFDKMNAKNDEMQTLNLEKKY